MNEDTSSMTISPALNNHAAQTREEALSNSISIAQQSVWWMEREHGLGRWTDGCNVVYIKIDMPPTRMALFKKRFIVCARIIIADSFLCIPCGWQRHFGRERRYQNEQYKPGAVLAEDICHNAKKEKLPQRCNRNV